MSGQRLHRGIILIATLCLFVASPAFFPPSAQAEDAYTPTMLILDASGSMNTKDAPGSRIDAAKNAVKSLVDHLPSASRVGLEVYGTSTGSTAAEKTAGCRDIKILSPVAPLHAAKIKEQVAGIVASGYTPIGAALQKAAAALPANGPRSIVLVSDGEDTCAPPDPCAVAKDLKASGIDLVIHTLGFRVDDSARRQLSCIAAATGGTYSNVNDAAGLTKALTHGVEAAIKPYSVTGMPIKGTATPAGAPLLTPGQYVDSAESPTGRSSVPDPTSKYYSIDVHPGETAYISGTLIVPPGAPTGSILQGRLTLTSQTDSGCSITNLKQSLNLLKSVDSTTVTLSTGTVGGPNWPKDCPTDGTMLLEFNRGGDAFKGQPLATEIALHVEPPTDSTGLPGPSSLQPPVSMAAAGKAAPIISGTSYNDAPLLKPGTYSDSIVPGEAHYVKVHLDWGQRLAYAFSTSVAFDNDGVLAVTAVSNPMRAAASLSDGGPEANSAFLGRRKLNLSGSTAVAVNFTNRNSASDAVQAYAIDGDYYVRLKAGMVTSGTPAAIRYTLHLQVEGAPVPGPVYQQPQQSQHAPSNAASGAKSATAPSNAQSGGTHAAGITPVLVGSGAVGLAVVAGTVWLLFRRRGSSH